MLPGVRIADAMSACDAEAANDSLEHFHDPVEILTILNNELGREGNIKDLMNKAVFQSLLKSDKLANQCLLLNVLEATKDNSVMIGILNDGAWKTLYGWLQDAKAALNKPFLLELLKLYHELPITVELLKQNSCAKDIKHLIKCNDEKISRLSKVIIDKWMGQVKEKTGESTKKNDKSSGHMSNHTSSKLSKDGKHSNKSSDSSTNQTHHSSHKSKSSEDKNLNAVNAQFSHGTAIVSDSSNQDSSGSASSFAKEILQRPKTVKTHGSRFRATGLEMESPLPHKKKSTTTPNNSLSVSSVKKPLGSQEKKVSVNIPTTVNSSASSSPTDVKAKPKLIQPRPKPPEIFESSGFMDALGTAEVLPRGRKRKLSVNNVIQKSSASPSSTEDKKPAVPSFYRDTMEMSQEDKPKLVDENAGKGSHAAAIGDSIAAEENDVELKEINNDSEVKLEEGDEIGGNIQSDEVSEPPPKKRKKIVTWADDSKLCSFFYFQLDETERVNVNKIDFAETRKHELEMERQMFQNVKRMANDTMAAKTQWRKPPLTTGIPSLVIPGCNSTERKAQLEREQSVLQVLYFNKSMIPDTAAEAEMEYFELVEPKDIPLTDVSGNGEICYDHLMPNATSTNHDARLPLSVFGMAPGGLIGGDLQQQQPMPQQMQQPPLMQQPPMMPPMRPGLMPPFMQPMQPIFNMLPNMPGNMNKPLMDGRTSASNGPYDMQGPNQGNNMPGPMMPMMPRPGMAPPLCGFPPQMRPDMRPEFMMGSGPQNHPALMGGGDMEMNRRNERMINPQDMQPRMMQPRDGPPRGGGGGGGQRIVCTHFQSGYCRFGSICRYLHQRTNGSPH